MKKLIFLFLISTLVLSCKAQLRTNCVPRPATVYVNGTGSINYLPVWSASKTLGTSRLYDDGTYLGINNTSPFNVNTIFQITAATNKYGFVQYDGTTGAGIFVGSGIGGFGTLTASDFGFFTNNGSASLLYLQHSTQNVGIGNISPTYKLTVTTTDANFGYTHTNGTIFQGSYIGAGFGQYGTITNHPLLLIANSGAATIQLATNKNVQIGGDGSTTPAYRLEVNTLTNNYGIAHTDGTVVLSSYLDGSIGYFGTKTNHPFVLLQNDGVAMTINSSKNVGVGTIGTSASAKLHVLSTTTTSATYVLKLENSSFKNIFSVQSDGTLSGYIMSGVYTPTLTNTTNVAASTPYPCQYMRVGNTVTVSGVFDLDATAAANTFTVLEISLPIASAIAQQEQVGGTASGLKAAIPIMAAMVTGEVTNDRAVVWLNAQSATNDTYSFSFTYQIL